MYVMSYVLIEYYSAGAIRTSQHASAYDRIDTA